MGSNKNKKIMSKVLLTGVILSMVSVDVVPLLSLAEDFKYEGEITTLEETTSPEPLEESTLLEEEVDEGAELPEDETIGEVVNGKGVPPSGVADGEVEYIEDGEVEDEVHPVPEEEINEEAEVEDTVEEPVHNTKMQSRIAIVQSTNNYVMATDSDFSGTINGTFKYIGDDEYVEIPNTIKGVNVTSYKEMFRETKVKGVKSTNNNVTDMSYMFYNYGSESLDVSQLDTSGVTDMGNMFGASNDSQTELVTLVGLEEFDTSKVTKMNNMFTMLKSTTLNLQNFNTSNVITMSAMFRDSKARKINTDSFDTRKVTNMSQMFMNTASATSLEFSKLDTSNVTNMSNMFSHTKDMTLDFSNFNTSKVTDMNYMFYASYAQELDLSTFDTSNVTNMSAMFRSSSAKSVDFSSFNTENVIHMTQMFDGSQATNLDLSSFDTRKVYNMSGMFRGSRATNIKGLNGFNTEKVSNMSTMFKDTILSEIDLSSFNTVNVMDMSDMFRNTGTVNLDLSSFNTSNVTHMTAMFQDAKATYIDMSSFNTTNVVNMGYMFYGINAEDLDLRNFNTTNVKSMGYMFQESKIKKLDISSFNTSKVTNMRNMFEGTNLERIDLMNFNTSNVTNMSNMFKDTEATYIGLSSFNTMNVLEMVSMFQGSKVTNIDLRSFATYKVSDMTNMFNGTKAKSINVSRFDTSLVTSMEGMFRDTQLDTIDISSFDLSSVNNIEGMFEGTTATSGLARSSVDADKASSSKGKPETLKITPKYAVANDEDFSGTLNGYFKYTGKDSFVEIPHTIKGIKVNSYKGMFEGTTVKGVVSTNKNVTDMSNMFNGVISEELEVSGVDTTGVITMEGMFQNTLVSTLDLRNFNTEKVTTMDDMFRNTKVKELDLGSFETSKVVSMENMFNSSETIVGYARTKEDADKLNRSSNKPEKLKFTVWGVLTSQDTESWTNKPVTIKVTAESEVEGVDYITWVNEPSRNLVILKDLVSYSGYNTPFIHDVENYSVTTKVKSDNNLVFSAKKGLEIGDEYTQSGYMYVNGKPLTQSMVRGTRLNTSEPAITPIVVDDETGYFKQTQQNVGNSSFWMHAYGTFNFPEGTEVTLRKLKVEKGREATEWTLSPEDASLGEEPGEFTVYTNGAYVFRAIGNKGNSKEAVHTVTNIDTVSPKAELTKSTEGWTSQDVTVYVNAEDALSGVKSITLPDGKVVNASTAEYVAKENRDYTITVTDKAGNKETHTTTVSNIDKSRPQLTATLDNKNWTKDPINIKVSSGESVSGLVGIEMINSPLEGRNLLSNSKLDISTNKDSVFVRTQRYLTIPEGLDIHGLVYGKPTTLSYNQHTVGSRVESPYFSEGVEKRYGIHGAILWEDSTGVRGDTTTYNYFNHLTTERNNGRVSESYTAKSTTHDKIKGYSFPIQPFAKPSSTNNETWSLKDAKFEVGEKGTPWTPAPEDIPLINNTKTYPVVANGLYTFEATYNNGTTSEVSVNVTSIDLGSPTITVTDNPIDWVEDDEITLKIKARDELSGVSSITLPNGEEIDSSTATYKVTKNGEYEFKVKDNVGNVTIHKETVRYLMIPYNFYIFDENSNPVEGAMFELLRNGESYKQATSGSDGLVDFGKVPPEGKYTIRQTTAPGGVVIDPEDIESGDVTEPIEVISYPRGTILPSTGTLGLIGYIGVVLATVLSAVVVKKRKTKNK